MNSTDITLIGGMVLVTFLIRYPPIALSGRLQLSDRILQALNYVPPAVLTAIVMPAVFVAADDDLWLSWQNPRLMGAIAAFAIGLWRKNLLLTIVVGMGVFLLWQIAWS